MSFIKKNVGNFLHSNYITKAQPYTERSCLLASMDETAVKKYIDDDSESDTVMDRQDTKPSSEVEDDIAELMNSPAVDVRWFEGIQNDFPNPEDEPDFSLRNLTNGSTNYFKQPSVYLAQHESSGDVLGMLSQTPDAFLEEALTPPLFANGAPSTTQTDGNVLSTKWSSRYKTVPFKPVMPDVFIRDKSVHLRLEELEPVPATLHIFNQYKVTVLLEHGGFQWEVRTRLKNISNLHNKLLLFKVKLRVPAATQSTRNKKQSMKAQLHEANKMAATVDSRGTNRITLHKQRSESDDFNPSTDDDLVRNNSQLSTKSFNNHRAIKYPRKSLSRMDDKTEEDLEVYLRNLLLHPLFRSHKDVLSLFEISGISFVAGLGRKLKEGMVKKRSGGYSSSGGCSVYCCQACDMCSGRYYERWLVLKETYLFFIMPKTGEVRGVLLMDQDFQVSNGFRHTGINNGLIVTSLSRRLTMVCDSDQLEKEWSAEIRRVQHQFASDFISGSNRHKSFAPERHNSLANWYVDGNRYMWDVADVIDHAVEEVFITDWWLSPDIYMKRPDLTATQWKLSEVLKRAAERGVKIYILVYKEVEMALGLNSLYTKRCLMSQHPNIKVLRHPDHGGGGTLYWAHHEKVVVVDQQHAFVGGIDLCYGRWDDYRHRLVDLGHAGLIKKDSPVVTKKKPSPSPVMETKKLKDNRDSSSTSSLAQLVMGTNMLFTSLHTPASTSAGSQEDSPTQSPKGSRHKDRLSETALEKKMRKKKVKPKLSLQMPLNSSSPNLIPNSQPIGFQSFSTIGSPRDAEVSEDVCGLHSDRKKSSVTDRTVSTDLDAVDDSLNNIPDIVEEVKDAPSDSDSGPPTPIIRDIDGNLRASCEELKLLYPPGLNPHVVVTPARSDSENDVHNTESQKKAYRKYTLFKKSKTDRKWSTSSKSDIRRRSTESDGKARRGAKSDSESSRKKSILKNRIFKSDVSHDGRTSGTEVSDDERRGNHHVSKNLEAMRSRGRELMGEVKNRGSDVKNWTRRKMPTLTRHNSNESEADLQLQARENTTTSSRKSTNRWRNLGKNVRNREKLRQEQIYEMEKKKYQHHGPTLYESTSIHLWVGKDYVNWITKDLNDPEEPFSDSVDRHKTPRMPWHDIGLYVEGPAARDVARHFIQRWNAVKTEKVKPNDKYPYLLPKTYHPGAFSPSTLAYKQKVRCQVLRSVGEWSSGQHEAERSIYNAYHSAIRNAKHYVYIENQFFISNSSDSSMRKEVHNRIAGEIVERIARAHRSNTLFRVYIILPLLPAFEGQIGTPSGTAMQFILHYTYNTIIRGEKSLITSLEAKGVVNWRKYLCFCSLRSHDTLEGSLVSELVYVHSKLIIVDDKLVIAGSANINDRSMLGERDSEVALVMEDEEFEEGVMNGKPFRRGMFAGSLRRYLFSEHLGLIEPLETDSNESDTPDQALARKAAQALSYFNSNAKTELKLKDIVDPVSDHFYNDIWRATSANNTKVYDEVFQCYPTDKAKTFSDVERLRSTPALASLDPAVASKKLEQVQGNVVDFPLEFLQSEVLKPGLGNRESLLPTEMWT